MFLTKLLHEVGKSGHTEEWIVVLQKISYTFFKTSIYNCRWRRAPLLIGSLAYLEACGAKRQLIYCFKAFNFTNWTISSRNCENYYLFYLHLKRKKIVNLAPKAVCPKFGIYFSGFVTKLKINAWWLKVFLVFCNALYFFREQFTVQRALVMFSFRPQSS